MDQEQFDQMGMDKMEGQDWSQEQQIQEEENESVVKEGKKSKKQIRQDNKKQFNNKDYYAQFLQTHQEVEENAPFVVVVQGPPKCGKSTLIRSIIKHYTHHKVSEIKGTATMRAGKSQRITLIQAPNDINSLIDLSKIPDLVLLMIDASIGFQMQTFQYLSLLKAHSFPNIMGVLTHLDYFKDGKQLRKTRKKYKKRFQFQVGNHYKLFNLQGCKNDLYSKRDVINMARFFSIIKLSKSQWKIKNPYILIDLFQNIKDQHKVDDLIDVKFFGYIRGASFRNVQKMHLVGLGDYEVEDIKELDDPCPNLNKKLQIKQQQDQNQQENKPNQKKKKTRNLKRSQRILYAPGSNLGFMDIDNTGGFITIPDQYVYFTKKPKLNQNSQNQQQDQQSQCQGVKMVRNLHQLQNPIDKRLNKETMLLLDDIQMSNRQSSISQNQQEQYKMRRKQIKILKNKTKDIFKQDNTTGQIDLHQIIYKSKQITCEFDSTNYLSPNIKTIQQYASDIRHKFVTGYIPEQDKDQEESDQQEVVKSKLLISDDIQFKKRGSYVRIIVKGVKYAHYLNFSYENPIILSKINFSQQNNGFLKTRVKKHPWYGNLLKSNDPIIVSCGWRRYQTIPYFFTIDINGRNRYLKYTIQHDFCNCVFYGNFMTQNTGLIMTQTLRNNLAKFRIAATGEVLQLNRTFDIEKKLKLIGQPFKIFKNTAFIKGMFNSNAQAASYQGALIKTVSGIRGQIKKAIKQGGQGSFRATFEDKILKSDIVFCRTWYKIRLQKFYNPIVSYQKQRLMKTTWQLRKQKQMQTPLNANSEYKDIQRIPRKFEPLYIPKKLEQNLPFKSRQKWKQKTNKQKIREEQNQNIPKVLGTEQEKEIGAMIQRLNTIKNQRDKMRKIKHQQKRRIKEARQRPRLKYYEQQKKQFKKQKYKNQARKKLKRSQSNKQHQQKQ